MPIARNSSPKRLERRRLAVVSCMVLIFCAAIVFIPTASLAQQSTGSLSGIVTDSTGAVIPGAKIILLNQSNGITRESQSNSTGGT